MPGNLFENNTFSNWTKALWFTTDNTGSEKTLLAAFETSANRNFIIQKLTTDKIFAVMYNTALGAYLSCISTTTVSTGTFYHVAVTYDGTTLRLYIDGSEEASDATSSGTLNTNSVTEYIGRLDSSITAQDWDGKVDECGVWNRALGSSEVSDLYNSGNGFNPFTAATINVFDIGSEF